MPLSALFGQDCPLIALVKEQILWSMEVPLHRREEHLTATLSLAYVNSLTLFDLT